MSHKLWLIVLATDETGDKDKDIDPLGNWSIKSKSGTNINHLGQSLDIDLTEPHKKSWKNIELKITFKSNDFEKRFWREFMIFGEIDRKRQELFLIDSHFFKGDFKTYFKMISASYRMKMNIQKWAHPVFRGSENTKSRVSNLIAQNWPLWTSLWPWKNLV